MEPPTTASAQATRPVASRRNVNGSVSTTFGGVPRVWVGPGSPIAHCTAAYGGTRTSTERPGCCRDRIAARVRVQRASALRSNGVYVTLGGETGALLGGLIAGPLRSLFSDRWSGLLLWWKPFHPPDLATLHELIAAGKLTPVIDRRYRLSQIVEALRYVEDDRSRGKVMITMNES